jgi:hypothetical protein
MVAQRTKCRARIAMLILVSLLISLIAIVMFFPATMLTVGGLLKGERFYAGHPTSYWHRELSTSAETLQLEVDYS